jgi:lysozyme
MGTGGLPSRRDALKTSIAAGLGAAFLLGLGGCSGNDGIYSANQDETETEQEHGAYDWTLMGTDEHGRTAFCPDGQVASSCGIDVSDHNGTIDWNAVAQDGISFAFLRAGYRGYTEGGIFADERFEANLEGASAAGLNVGAYFYSSAVDEDEAREEAQYLLDCLAGRLEGCYLVFDQEIADGVQGRANSLTREQYTNNAVAFCEVVEAAGHPAIVYSNRKHLVKLDLTGLGGRELWYAEYGVDNPQTLHDFMIWQYSDSGTVAGVEGYVDMDLWFPTDYLLSKQEA